MQNTYTLLDINLQLFDGAAAGAPAAGPAGEGAAQQSDAGALPKAETKKGTGSSRRSKAGAFENVVFGKQEDAPQTAATTPAAGETNGEGNAKRSGVSTTSDSLEAKREAFKNLIEGEYKEQYTEMFQNAFNRRFKESKGMEASLNAQKPIMDILMQRYNIQDGDVAKLQNAIEQDNVYWEDAAEEAGLTVEQYKAMKRLERENAELQQMRRRQQADQQAQQKMNQWYAEAEQVKQLYPGFDFQREAANRQFTDLLKANIPVRQAYELVHMEEIKAATAKTAAQTAGQQMAAKIQSKAARPQENGMSSQSAVIVKNDVHNLSRAERAEIARRVQRGEKIRF